MKYFIIGGTGSLGKKLIERLLPKHHVCVYSRDEAKHFTIRNEFSQCLGSAHLTFIVGDVRDFSRLKESIKREKPDVIILAAALKQVETCELSPNESIKTNLTGTQNVIMVIDELKEQIKKCLTVLFVSTDKACSPVNVYGMCKATSERIVTSQAQFKNRCVTYLAVRYGNVLESRGSIIPLFKYQGINNDYLTVTDPKMTRFLMTLDDSVDLIQKAIEEGKSGETWIPKLPSMNVGDLADIFSEKYSKEIKVIGLRPGEKMHEDLINESESVRTSLTNDKKNYVISPAFEQGNESSFTYTSADDVMKKEQLRLHLQNLGILDSSLESHKGISVEEIMTNRK